MDECIRTTEKAIAYLEVGVGPIRATLAAFDGDRILVAQVTRRTSLGTGEGSAAWRQVADMAGSVAERCSSLASAAASEVTHRSARLLGVKELMAETETVQP